MVLASAGYPAAYEKGYEITVPEEIWPHVLVAGAAEKDGKLVTSGGRVLGVTAVADTLADAVAEAYAMAEKVRLLNRYDVEDITRRLFDLAVREVLSEPQLDRTSAEADTDGAAAVFAVEYLPGQFDQRADSAAQCIQIISQGERPLIRSAKVYLLYGSLTPEEIAEIKKYVINPVEAREAALEKPDTLRTEYAVPDGGGDPGGLYGAGPGGAGEALRGATAWPWTRTTSPSARPISGPRAGSPPSRRSGCWIPTGAITAGIPPS